MDRIDQLRQNKTQRELSSEEQAELTQLETVEAQDEPEKQAKPAKSSK